ncbi:diguanylate cyclase [Shewanella sp. 5_MG-2023]|uniref:tetratricopeptide repeat-containing diguanylate cyclase n=1 Tax=Shewanella sp. 5_MG-2023 TaxID=3062656 RepID=UPI0026E34A4E|nr:tetratricopeptide repeat-containing diguanylate cyclase [Shewanella sp. 5_MG-2023]MDO6641469.1 diguanylate cyclase [Shewanella sp. 5_MG-2023]
MNHLLRHSLLPVLLLFFCGIFSTAATAAKPPVFDLLDEIACIEHGPQLTALYLGADKDPEGTLTALEQLKSQGVIDGNDYFKTIYYLILYNVQFVLSDVEAAEKTTKTLYQFGLDSGQDWIVAEGLTIKGTLAARKSEGKKALRLIEQAISLAEQLHYDRLLARALNIRGIIHSRSLAYELAIEDYQRAIKLAETTNNSDFVFKLYSNISVLYSMVEDWPSAIEYNKKATELYLKSDNVSFEYLVILYSNASNNMLEINDIEAATQYSEKSIAVARESNNNQLIVNALMTQTHLLISQQLFAEAEPVAMECVELAKQVHDQLPYNECLMGLGEVSLFKGDSATAGDYANNAMAGLKAIDNQDSLLKSYELLARVYQAQQRYPEAIEQLTTYYEGTQKLLFNQREEQLFALKALYEGQLQDEKIALLTAENELKAATLDKKELQERIWLLALAILAIGLVLLIRRYFLSEKNIDSLRTSNKSLYKASNNDQLTGLHNRRYIEHFIHHELTAFPNAYYCMLMIDCDNFKKVNDNYGHDTGDIVLTEIAKRLSNSIRKGDVLVRWGGEEFIILLQVDEADPTSLDEVLSRFNQAISTEAITTPTGDLMVTVSIGASQPTTAKRLVEEWDSILKLADTALYQAKDAGRNCAVIADK